MRAGDLLIGDENKMDDALAWDGNWAWSLPLIVVTVIVHALSMVYITDGIVRAAHHVTRRHHKFALLIGAATLLAIALHAFEAGIWAAVYVALGALPDGKSALLYSLNAMTSYGHESIRLAAHWQLMGALEALNGMILFGLTTAFLYGMIRTLLIERGE
jgi:hypothetical protein